MRVVYYSKDALKISSISNNLKWEDIAMYFSSNKSFPVIVDNQGFPVGYYDYESFSLKGKDNQISYKCFDIISREFDLPGPVIYNYFEKNHSSCCIPVIDKNSHLIGAYVKEDIEINSFTSSLNALASAYLPVFGEFVSSYLKKNFESFYFIGANEQYEKLSIHIPSIPFSHIGFSEISQIDAPNSLVIDACLSKRYRERLFRDKSNIRISSLSEIMAASIVKDVVDYIKKSDARVLFIEGPIKEKMDDAINKWPQLYKKLSFQDAVSDKQLSSHFDIDVINCDNYLITDGMCYIMSDYSSANLNVVEGRRITVGQTNGLNILYCYGPCLTFGSCVKDSETIPSYLQTILNKKYPSIFSVQNLGVNYGRNCLNDFVRILNTPLKNGDYVVLINAFEYLVQQEIESIDKILPFSSFFNRSEQSDCYFLENSFHTNAAVNKLIADYISNHIICEPQSKCSTSNNHFQRDTLVPRVDVSELLDMGLLRHYKEYLEANRFPDSSNKVVGAVILTADPLTKGHKYLVETAKQKCDYLYVFIVDRDCFHFRFLDRFEMARRSFEGTNIKVLTTGHLMTAAFTFPEYFTKEKSNIANAIPIPNFHALVFANIVCRILGISIRFIGNEMSGSVTEKYNLYLKEMLPLYGIKVVEIQRCLSRSGQAISSSKAREAINQGNMSILTENLSQDVIRYITGNYILHNPFRTGQWTKSYIVNNHFYKVFNFYIPSAIEREINACSAAIKTGLPTPILLGCKKLSRTACLCFELCNMTTLDDNNLLSSKQIQKDIVRLLDSFQSVEWDHTDDYWRTFLLKEFEYALSFLPESSERYMAYLRNLKSETFIHGDFVKHNIGCTESGVVIFDFQHGSYGPKGFDKGYFASCYPSGRCNFLRLTNQEKSIAECMAAIRLGRAYRNGKDANEIKSRNEILDTWRGHVMECKKQ